MSYDIDRETIYRYEITQAQINEIEGLDDLVLPQVTEIIWQSTGDFLLTLKKGDHTEYFHLNQEMLETINKVNIERNPWVFSRK